MANLVVFQERWIRDSRDRNVVKYKNERIWEILESAFVSDSISVPFTIHIRINFKNNEIQMLVPVD